MIFVFEGADGCGKDTAADAVSDILGIRVIRFPDRKTQSGKEIDHQLKCGIPSPTAFQALQIANRAEKMPALLHTSGHPRNHLILVRYWQSGVVYGVVEGLPKRWLVLSQDFLPRADLNILFAVRPSILAQRRAERRGRIEVYETGEKDRAICDGYLRLWRKTPDSVVVNAENSKTVVKQHACALLRVKMQEAERCIFTT